MGFAVVIVHPHQLCRTRGAWEAVIKDAVRDAFEEELVAWLKKQL